jgi:hypothetical protein
MNPTSAVELYDMIFADTVDSDLKQTLIQLHGPIRDDRSLHDQRTFCLLWMQLTSLLYAKRTSTSSKQWLFPLHDGLTDSYHFFYAEHIQYYAESVIAEFLEPDCSQVLNGRLDANTFDRATALTLKMHLISALRGLNAFAFEFRVGMEPVLQLNHHTKQLATQISISYACIRVLTAWITGCLLLSNDKAGARDQAIHQFGLAIELIDSHSNLMEIRGAHSMYLPAIKQSCQLEMCLIRARFAESQKNVIMAMNLYRFAHQTFGWKPDEQARQLDQVHRSFYTPVNPTMIADAKPRANCNLSHHATGLTTIPLELTIPAAAVSS